MKIRDVMTTQILLIRTDSTLCDAALLMRRHDVGSLPVSDGERLVGMVTDRDLVIRGLAEGLDPLTPVREVMTGGVKFCYDDEGVDEVVRSMAQLAMRRLPVVDRFKRLVGFVSLSGIVSAVDGAKTRGQLHSIARTH